MPPLRLPVACILALLTLPSASRAEVGELEVHFEPAAAMFVSAPQRDRFGWGGGGALAIEWALSERLGLEAVGQALVFEDGPAPAAATGLSDPGMGGLLMVGGGVRFRPFNDQSGYAVHVGSERHHRGNLFGNVWLAMHGGWVRTGPRDRIGFDAGLGLELSLIDGVQVGPFVKYLQVVETASQVAPQDARVALAGLSVTIGAPSVHPSDRDGDDVLDVDDRCPDDAEDPDGFEDADGCPDLDNDHDDVPDVQDRCPNVAEDPDGFEDHDGCPEPGPVRRAAPAPVPLPRTVVEEREEDADILLDQRVLFETSRAYVRVHYRTYVELVRQLMQERDDYLRVRIEGHADERGTDAFNDWLSTERARRVAAFLEQYGLDPGRIEIVGYGRRRPAAPGRTLNALRLNRRVEFRIVRVRRTVEIPAPVEDSPPPAVPAGPDVEPNPFPTSQEPRP